MTTRQLLLNKAQWILGWMSMEELSFLAEIASELKEYSVIYEIGCLCGRSTRALADNSPLGSTVYAIDCWDHKILTEAEPIIVDINVYNQFCMNLQDHIRSCKVITIAKRWENVCLPTKHDFADFIFIDADHEYESVKRDVLKALKYLKPNGLIAGHDYNFETVYAAVNEIFNHSEIKTRGNIWWTRKS